MCARNTNIMYVSWFKKLMYQISDLNETKASGFIGDNLTTALRMFN